MLNVKWAMIPLSAPNLAGNEWQYVKDCLDTGWISSAGSYVTQFESAVAAYTGARHAVACVNGTLGLHTALMLAGVKQSDYVIAPNLTFIATINAIKYCGAEPILLDIDPNSWQIDLDLLQEFLAANTRVVDGSCVHTESGRTIRAIVPVHVLGNMCDMQSLCSIVKGFGLKVVEDACESLGSFNHGKHSGTIGQLGVLSFNGNKIISTGGGGMILTDDDALAKQAIHMTTQAKVMSTGYEHDEIGYNYRMVNVLAAIGLAQIEQLPQILKRNKQRDSYYRSQLASLPGISFQSVDSEVNPNCWLFTLQCDRSTELLEFLRQEQIEARPFWRPMSELPMFTENIYVNRYDIAHTVYSKGISIPSSSSITDDELEQVVDTIKRFTNKAAVKAENKPVPTSAQKNELEDAPVKALETQGSVLPPEVDSSWKVQLFELNYDEREAQAAHDVIQSGWITMGDQIKQFEAEFEGLLQNRVKCMAMSSCTAALHTALSTLGIGPGDEVVIPALTFVADANVVRVLGATPVPADCESIQCWNVSADTILPRISKRTKAVMIVHYAGYPCDMDAIVELCKEHDLPLVEDVAHAPGALYKGQACGTFGEFGCFSFFTNKNLSIGEGGMLVSASPDLVKRAGFFRSQGMTSQTLDRHHGRSNAYDVALPGLNYRMDEMRAAIGRVQLEKLANGNERRKYLFAEYARRLADCPELRIPFGERSDCDPSYHIFPVLLPEGNNRSYIIEQMKADGIQTSIHYQSFRSFSTFDDLELPITEIADQVSSRVLTLPLFPTMSAAQCALVCDSLVSALTSAQG